eukprot:7388608-Karenia_brevis.AAC.1
MTTTTTMTMMMMMMMMMMAMMLLMSAYRQWRSLHVPAVFSTSRRRSRYHHRHPQLQPRSPDMYKRS